MRPVASGNVCLFPVSGEVAAPEAVQMLEKHIATIWKYAKWGDTQQFPGLITQFDEVAGKAVLTQIKPSWSTERLSLYREADTWVATWERLAPGDSEHDGQVLYTRREQPISLERPGSYAQGYSVAQKFDHLKLTELEQRSTGLLTGITCNNLLGSFQDLQASRVTHVPDRRLSLSRQAAAVGRWLVHGAVK